MARLSMRVLVAARDVANGPHDLLCPPVPLLAQIVVHVAVHPTILQHMTELNIRVLFRVAARDGYQLIAVLSIISTCPDVCSG